MFKKLWKTCFAFFHKKINQISTCTIVQMLKLFPFYEIFGFLDGQVSTLYMVGQERCSMMFGRLGNMNITMKNKRIFIVKYIGNKYFKF